MEDELTKVAQDSARGGFFLISGTVISTVILAISSILIARLLGPELYGQYALALVVPQLLFLFTDLGINQGITKFTSDLQSKGETNRIANIIKHGLLLRATIGIGIFIINYAFADLIASILLQRPDLAFYIQLASISILFQVIFTTATSAFVGLDKTEYQALTTNVLATAKTIISIALILIGLSITGAIAGYVISYIVAAVTGIPLLLLMLRKKKKAAKSDGFKTNLKTLFQYGTPLYISVLLTGFLPFFTSVILALFATDTDIGNYKAAINFAALLTVLSGPITTVLLPAFSKLNSATSQKINRFFRITNKYTAIIIIPITFLIIIFSNELVQIIYGSTYASAPLFLSTYCLLYFLVGIGYLNLQSLYNGLGETKTTLKISLISFFALILLSLPLTQAYGVQGIIVAFLLANTMGTLYGAYKARKKFKIEFDSRNILKIYLISLVSSAAPLLLINFANLPNLLTVAVGGLVYLFSYATLLPLTNVITHSELRKATLITQNTRLLSQITKPLFMYQQIILQLKPVLKKLMFFL